MELTGDRISKSLGTERFGRVLQVHDTVTSTNDLARVLADAGAPEGAVVIAREQLTGRGRLGRQWVSPRGGLYLSVILRPAQPLDEWPLLGFLLAVASCGAIDALTGLRTGVKWPNDVMIGSRKLGGVLVEATPAFVVGGVGLNANLTPATLGALENTATSIQALTGHPVELSALAAMLLTKLEGAYSRLRTDKAWLLDEWRRRSVAMGRRIRVTGATTLEGVAEGIDDTGALLIRTAEGVQVVRAGDVSIRLVETGE
jgi:BirA family biotin operon repressor/biotin-[acetyl-CoA-carboxylase] ligase